MIEGGDALRAIRKDLNKPSEQLLNEPIGCRTRMKLRQRMKGDTEMVRRIGLTLFVVILGLVMAAPALAAGGGRPESDIVIYVESQGLYYDSIPGPRLPQKGPFQELDPNGSEGLTTEFGPGAPGHKGGRWWVDSNPNGEMDAEDTYFVCPLLGPGRETP
jgi:hypothetical protein